MDSILKIYQTGLTGLVGFFSPTARYLKAEGPYIQIILSILSSQKKLKSNPFHTQFL